MHAIGWLLSLGGTLAMTASLVRAEPRPSSVALGVAAAVEAAPFADQVVAMPVSIDAGTVVDGELWWHASVHFGRATIEGEPREGNTFELQTGPRVRHCLSARTCVGASLEVGWGHARWNPADAYPRSYDDIHLEARLRASVALTPTGRVSLEGSAGPRSRYYVRSVDDAGMSESIGESTHGVVLGLALVVRN